MRRNKYINTYFLPESIIKHPSKKIKLTESNVFKKKMEELKKKQSSKIITFGVIRK